MRTKNFGLNNIRVASPCPVSWESMSGDGRARHCGLCELNVYNISGMTRGEAEELIANREGRLCVRFYRRADGTVITEDCPVGLRAVRKRVVSFAGAALAAVLGLFSVSYGQESKDKPVDASMVKVVRSQSEIGQSKVFGTLMDANGAVIPGGQVVLTGDAGQFSTVSDSVGVYLFANVPSGIYKLQASSPAFKKYLFKNLRVNKGEKLRLDVEMIMDAAELIGVVATTDEPIIDMGASGVTTKITQRQIQNLPH